MLVNKHQLLFRTGHFITQSSDTLRIHSFPGEFVQQDALIRNKQEEIHLSIASEKQKTDELLATMDKDLLHELSGKGVDTERITALRNEVARTEQELGVY